MNSNVLKRVLWETILRWLPFISMNAKILYNFEDKNIRLINVEQCSKSNWFYASFQFSVAGHTNIISIMKRKDSRVSSVSHEVRKSQKKKKIKTTKERVIICKTKQSAYLNHLIPSSSCEAEGMQNGQERIDKQLRRHVWITHRERLTRTFRTCEFWNPIVLV